MSVSAGSRQQRIRHGVFLYPSGEVYVGQWRPPEGLTTSCYPAHADVDASGHCTSSSDESSDEGESLRQTVIAREPPPCRCGWGVYLRGGERYEGEWANNKRHGLGCMSIRSGKRYIGQFAHGVQSGRGVSVSPTGEVCTEVWEANQLTHKCFLLEDEHAKSAYSATICTPTEAANGSLACPGVPSGSSGSLAVASLTGSEPSGTNGDAQGAGARSASPGVSSSSSSSAMPLPHSASEEVDELIPSARELRDPGRPDSTKEKRSNLKCMKSWTVNDVAHLLDVVGMDTPAVERLRAHKVDGSVLSTLASLSAEPFLHLTFGSSHGSPDRQLLVVAVRLLLKVRQQLIAPQISAEALRQRFKNVEILENELEFGDVIGEGGYGRVHKARWMHTDVAAKVFRNREAGRLSRDFCSELSVLQRLRHPNITLLIGFCFRPDTTSAKYIIVTEYLPGGSLFDLLHRQRHQPEWNLSKVVTTAFEICLGMVYLHSHSIVHCDLKSSNILLSETREVKICDFGLAHLQALRDQISLGCVGTHHWMAPEVLRGEEYSQAADVYSFGMILWEMISRQVPFNGYTSAQVIGTVGYGRRRPRLPAGCPEHLRQVLRKALRPRPQKRRPFQELSEDLRNLHSWTVIEVEESLWTFFAG